MITSVDNTGLYICDTLSEAVDLIEKRQAVFSLSINFSVYEYGDKFVCSTDRATSISSNDKYTQGKKVFSKSFPKKGR